MFGRFSSPGGPSHARQPRAGIPPNLDDAPRPVAVMARALEPGHSIPCTCTGAASCCMRWPASCGSRPPRRPGSCRRPARCGCRRNGRTASPCAATSRCARSTSTPRACEALPKQPVLVEISGLLRELILALLEEPADYAENGRGGIVARLMLTELARLQERQARRADAARCAGAAGGARPARQFQHRPRPRPLGRAGRRQPADAGPASSAAKPASALPNGARGCAPSTGWPACPEGPRSPRPPPRSAMPAPAPSPPWSTAPSAARRGGSGTPARPGAVSRLWTTLYYLL